MAPPEEKNKRQAAKEVIDLLEEIAMLLVSTADPRLAQLMALSERPVNHVCRLQNHHADLSRIPD